MEMVRLLQQLGVAIDEDAVLAQSAGGALGRPHVARALRKAGVVRTLDEAFDKYLGRGRPAFVDKALPTFSSVASLVHRLGGIVSAAHLKDRGNRARPWCACAPTVSMRSRPVTRATTANLGPGSPTWRCPWASAGAAAATGTVKRKMAGIMGHSARSRCRSSGWTSSEALRPAMTRG